MTQTQMAAQWSANQSRQRAADLQAPIAFLWAWCMPPFAVLLGGLALWGFWRWLRIRQANQRIVIDVLEQLPAPAPKVADDRYTEPSPYLEGEAIDGHSQVTRPEDQVHRWLDEVKHELRSNRKDEDDDADK
jgi:hypothetical protein